jgi:hypothetical protein
MQVFKLLFNLLNVIQGTIQTEILKLVSFNRSQYDQYFKNETKQHFKEFSPTFLKSKVFD